MYHRIRQVRTTKYLRYNALYVPDTDNFPEPREAREDRRGNVTSAGLDPDTWKELENWRTERRLKRSEATRRLIRTGLTGEAARRRPILGAGVVAGFVYTLVYLIGATDALAVVGGGYIAATILWALVPDWRD